MTSDSASDQPSVLQRIDAGDKAAVQDCINRYGGLIWSMARRLSPAREDAEDAVQEIFLDIWKHSGRFDPAQGTEKVFVAMIARRRLIDRLRSSQRRSKLESLPGDLTALADRTQVDETVAAEVAFDAGLAAKALLTLTNQQQVILKLNILLGLSHSEIAKNIGLPLGTVKTHIRRGLLQIRQQIATADEFARSEEQPE